MGMISDCKVVTSDTSSQGWEAIIERSPMNVVWTVPVKVMHLICLELCAVSLAFKHFLPQIKGCHVLVRSDNTIVSAYINRQVGIQSNQRWIC